jgi:transcriptional regulator with XRE-family HTH domain
MSTKINAHLYDRIRHARRTAELTQAALAKRVGVGASAVAQWESGGRASPTASNLAKVALATQVSFEWLATGRGAMSADSHVTPAAMLDAFAQDSHEERLLIAFRTVGRRQRELVVSLFEEILSRTQRGR